MNISESDDEPSSPLALYLRFSADFESRVTPPVTVTSSRRPYHSAEVISWHSACSFSYLSCYLRFLLICAFRHTFSGVTCDVTVRAICLADARRSRQASAALGNSVGYFCFPSLFDIFIFYSFSLQHCRFLARTLFCAHSVGLGDVLSQPHSRFQFN